MGKILVTGATGNVGAEVVNALKLANQKTISAVVMHEDLKKFPTNKAVVLCNGNNGCGCNCGKLFNNTPFCYWNILIHSCITSL